jgi:hypothetical protein
MTPIRAARRPLQALVIALCAAFTLPACGGPELPLEVFVKEEAVDITFGDQSAPLAPPARPPGAETINPGFPSFVAPPPPPVRPASATTEADPTPAPVSPTTVAAPACRTPDAFETAEVPVTSGVDRAPREGTYTYRRSGEARIGGQAVALSPAVERTISNAKTVSTVRGDLWQFDVTQREVNGAALFRGRPVEAKTITSYEVDPHATAQSLPAAETERVSGMKIRAVTTESGQGIDSFNPQPPVRFMTLPASQKGYIEGGSGTDPLTGMALDVRFQTVERAEVLGCGVVYQAWKQRVGGVYYNAASPPDATGDGLWFTSTLYVACQYGGLVLKDELHLSDQPPIDPAAVDWQLAPGRDIDVRSTTTINRIEPRPGT